MIEFQSSKLHEELEEFKIARLKEMQTTMDEVEKQLVIVSSFKNYAEELESKGSACDIARSTSNLLERSQELLKEQDQFSKKGMTPVEVTFTEGWETQHTMYELCLVGHLTLRGTYYVRRVVYAVVIVCSGVAVGGAGILDRAG